MNPLRSTQKPYRVPYGVADFIKLRRGREYYLDKTRYLPKLEEAGRHLFLIRPRRIGKSLLQSVMECYYDQNRADQFDELFGGTWIYDHPTEEQHQYMVLRFDFSLVHGVGEELRQSFEDYIRLTIEAFCRDYPNSLSLAETEEILSEPFAHKKFNKLLYLLNKKEEQLYLFIDEYDNFANTLLSTEGREAYQQLTRGRGFLRDFFAELKGATGRTGGALSRLFITGVSPVTMDDVTSGFNIGLNISLDPDFNAMLGFTEVEMVTLFAAFGQDYRVHQVLMERWYDHYRFCRKASETVTNSDMALYYLQAVNRLGEPPDDLIDPNIRIDHGKLRHLIQLERKLNGSFTKLNEIIANDGIASPIRQSFPAELLQESENFISLLYFFGLLTLSGEEERGDPKLMIPNRTVKDLMYSYIRGGLDDVGLFRPDIFTIGEKLKDMAWDGKWQPFFQHLADQIAAQADLRDYLNGEKMVQGFLLAWLNLNPWFYALSEQQLGGGFVDLYLYPFYEKYPEMGHAYLIELKYLNRSDDDPETRQRLIDDAKGQLQRYRNDERVLCRAGHANIHSLILLYAGWELVYCKEVALI